MEGNKERKFCETNDEMKEINTIGITKIVGWALSDTTPLKPAWHLQHLHCGKG